MKDLELKRVAEAYRIPYYRDFRVMKVKDSKAESYLAIAETYEKGRWRKVVITGRVYWEEHTARMLMNKARAAQIFLLKELANQEKPTSISIKNPIEHMEPNYLD